METSRPRACRPLGMPCRVRSPIGDLAVGATVAQRGVGGLVEAEAFAGSFVEFVGGLVSSGAVSLPRSVPLGRPGVAAR